LGEVGVNASTADVSAIVVNYESGADLTRCLDALSGQRRVLETIVVDNGSTDGSAAVAERRPETVLARPDRNVGFAGGANEGARRARGDYLLFLNPDVRLAPDAVALLAAAVERQSAGVAGPRIELERSSTSELGYTIDPLGSPRAATRADVLFVSGCALMTPARVFRALGGFDGRYFLFAEDIDYCWRALLAGHEVVVAPGAVAYHVGGGSTPGGYVTDRGLTTTRFRVRLRERNTLAMLLKCYGMPALVAVVPLYVLQTLGTAIVLIALRRPRTALDVLAGFWWNARELPRTLELRAAAQAARRRRDRAIVARMYRGWHKAAAVLHSGLPSVDEEVRARRKRPTPTASG
jgi:GT2 family glycosyltransferase